MKMFNCGLAILAIALLASPASAAIIAYEGFDAPKQSSSPAGTELPAPNNAPLASVHSSGFGFDGGWVITNGSGGASKFQTSGLDYPASYPGSNVAVGGKGRVTGAPGDNAFLALNLDAAADAAVNSSKFVYISWLAQNVSQSVTDAGVLDDATRTLFNLAAEYPRNSGIRLMNNGGNSNGALGTIGNGGNWNGNNQSTYAVGDVGPEVVDTWAAFNFNDANNIFTGNGGKGPGVGTDPDPDYNPAPANYDGVDHLVLQVDTTKSKYDLWVNLQADGSSDGHISWIHTDGDVVPFVLKGFGLEAGNNSSDRPVGDMVVDEIYISDQFFFATGFPAPAGIPEPSSVVALGGLLGIGAFVIRRRR